MPIYFRFHELDLAREVHADRVASEAVRLSANSSSGALLTPRADGDGVRLRLSREPTSGALFVEPARLSSEPVLVAAALGARILVNGLPAPDIAVLHADDVLSLDDGNEMVTVVVEAASQAYVGPPLPQHINVACALCLTKVTASPGEAAGSATVLYECPHCEKAILHVHAEVDGDPEPLECARLTSTCPRCGAPVDLEQHGDRPAAAGEEDRHEPHP